MAFISYARANSESPDTPFYLYTAPASGPNVPVVAERTPWWSHALVFSTIENA